MPIGIHYNEQYAAFVEFAAKSVASGKSKDVARKESDDNPFATQTIGAAGKDGPGGFAAMFRSGANKRANDVARDLFRESVYDMFGGERNVPESVKAAMKLEDYGSGKPLTARRVMAVKEAVDREMVRFAEAFAEAKANAVGAYRQATLQGKPAAGVDESLGAALRECAGDPDALAIVSAHADTFLLSPAVVLRGPDEARELVGRLKANLAELRVIAKDDPALLEEGLALLRSLKGKGLPDGILTKLAAAAKKAKTGPMTKIGPLSNALEIHKAVLQYRAIVSDALVSSGVEDALKGAEERERCRDFFTGVLLRRCGGKTLRSMDAALGSEGAAKLLATYVRAAYETGELPGDLPGAVKTAVQNTCAGLDQFFTKFRDTVCVALGGETAELKPFRGAFDRKKAKTEDVVRDLVALGREQVRQDEEAVLARVKGKVPAAESLREMIRAKLGPNCYEPSTKLGAARNRCVSGLLNWTVAADAAKFAQGKDLDTTFAKDIHRGLDVTIAGLGKLPNDFKRARDAISRFVARRQDATWDGLSPAEKRKAALVMAFLSQNAERDAFDGTFYSLDPQEKDAPFVLNAREDKYVRTFAVSFSPDGDLVVEYKGVRTGANFVMFDLRDGAPKELHLDPKSTYSADFRYVINVDEFERLADVDFSAFDSGEVDRARAGGLPVSKIVEAIPPAFRIGGHDTYCVTEFSADFS